MRRSAGPAPGIAGYALALVAVVAASALRGWLFGEMGHLAPLSTFYAAVMVAGWYGGWGPGLLATAASTAAAWHVLPLGDLSLRLDESELPRVAAHLMVCVLITALNAAVRTARRRAELGNEARAHAAAALTESEARIRQQQGRLLVLAETSHVIAQAGLDLDRVAHAVVERLTESVGDLCILRLLSADETTLEPIAFHHRDAAAREALRALMTSVPYDSGLLGLAVRSKQTVWRPRISADELLREVPAANLRAHVEKRGVHSLLIAPLLAGERVLGTLTLLRDGPGPAFTAEDHDLVCTLASRAAAAVENARLLRDEQAARAEAETANRMKDEFLATLSHELRTPLNAIVGWTELLRTGQLDIPTVQRALETIARNARVQTELVNDVLDVSRIVSGQFRIRLSSVALRAVVEAALETVRPAAEAKGIQLDVRTDPALSAVAGDASRLQQVAWNLLSNAVKFTPAGGRVEVRLANGHGRVDLVVTDTGAGIDASLLPHVFERFRQGDASTTRRHGGLGLGLAIVRHIVELHGGTVEAESEGPDRGATFRVKLPAMAIAPAVPPPSPPPPVPPATPVQPSN